MVRKFVEKHKEFLLYTFYGFFTMLINWGVFILCIDLIKMPTVPSTIIAWFLSILFSFFINRIRVFKSPRKGFKGILLEAGGFFLFRALSGLADVLVMYIGVDVLAFNHLIMKVIANIIVIIINYFFSILLFKKIKKDSNIQ